MMYFVNCKEFTMKEVIPTFVLLDVSTILYPMSQSEIIAIIGILCGVAIAVYLAYKQGIFKRTDLFVSVGAPFVSEGSERWFKKEASSGKSVGERRLG